MLCVARIQHGAVTIGLAPFEILEVGENNSADVYNTAVIGKSGAPTNGSISIAPNATKKNVKKKFAYYNKEQQRLDEPLPLKDPAGALALDSRMKKLGKNMCNNWYAMLYCDMMVGM